MSIRSHLTVLEQEQKNNDLGQLEDNFNDMEMQEGQKMKMKESLLDIVVQGESHVRKSDNERRPFCTFPPSAQLLPPQPLLLDIVRIFIFLALKL